MNFGIPKSLKTIIIQFGLVALLFAQNEALNDRFAFLQQLYFENTQHQYDAYLQTELESFLQKNPNFEQCDQIIWMFADVLNNENKTYRAIINYMKIPVLFPKSAIAKDARQKLQEILTHVKNAKLLEQKNTLLDYAFQPHYFESHNEALTDLYNFLFSLDLSCLKPTLLTELNQFDASCQPELGKRDLLLFLKGNLSQDLRQYFTAEADFRELISLYKSSSFYADALFRLGMIEYRHLHKFSEAQNTLLQVINNFPDDEHAPQAQFYLAELYADSLDSISAGIDNYRLFLDAFPEHPLFNKAFKRLAHLLFHTKRYEEAITLIGDNLNKHADDSTFYMLVDSMAKVFRTNLKKYDYAARCYVLLASAQPGHHKNPFYLFTAAKIYYTKLKNRMKAEEICQRLNQEYPQSPYAKKCATLLKQRRKK